MSATPKFATASTTVSTTPIGTVINPPATVAVAPRVQTHTPEDTARATAKATLATGATGKAPTGKAPTVDPYRGLGVGKIPEKLDTSAIGKIPAYVSKARDIDAKASGAKVLATICSAGALAKYADELANGGHGAKVPEGCAYRVACARVGYTGPEVSKLANVAGLARLIPSLLSTTQVAVSAVDVLKSVKADDNVRLGSGYARRLHEDGRLDKDTLQKLIGDMGSMSCVAFREAWMWASGKAGKAPRGKKNAKTTTTTPTPTGADTGPARALAVRVAVIVAWIETVATPEDRVLIRAALDRADAK